MSDRTLADLMTWNIVEVDLGTSLLAAAEIMETARISSLLVLEDGQAVGIVTERDILKALAGAVEGGENVARIMSSPVLAADSRLSVHHAYHLLAEQGIRHLLVTGDAGQPVGVVSESDFRFHLGAAFFQRWRDVGAVMQGQVPQLGPDAPVSQALSLMSAQGLRCILVTEDARPLGIVTERDALRLFRRGRESLGLPLSEVMSRPVLSIPENMPLSQAVDRMQREHVRHLVVVDGEGRVAGVVSEHDVVSQLEGDYLDFVLREGQAARAELKESRLRLSAVFDQTSELIGILDLEGRLLEANQSALALIGHDESAVLGRMFWETPWWGHDPLMQERIRQAVLHVAGGGEALHFEVSHPSAQGGLRYIDFILKAVSDEPGKPLQLLAEGRDITERKRGEEQRRVAASVFQSSQDGILITDPQGTIVDVNPAFTVLTGYTREEAVGCPARILNSGHHDPTFFRELFAKVGEQGFWQGELWNRTKAGSVTVVLMSISAVRDETDQLIHFVGVFSDITQQKENQRRLERLAHYDALTGLPNRTLMSDRLHLAMAQSRRRGKLLAVCYLDLDGFKEVNDRQGHQAGDRLLMDVAERLRHSLRGGDTAARLGGDEFVLLLNDLSSDSELEQILERLLASLARPFALEGQMVSISGSIGVTIFPTDDADADTLVRHADQAMYGAKQSGRNRYQIFDTEQDSRARNRREAIAAADQALRRGEFRLYYQPKVNLCSGLIVGFEALLRWQHPERGLLAPAAFLGDLEESDLIVAIGDWVIAEALVQLESWQALGWDYPVSVNIAARHLQQPDFLPRLQRALGRHPGVPPRLLELEILETAALEDVGQVSLVIAACQRLGVGFALDDFGTGYSSLSYFKSLPARTLKIDQSFVRDMLHDPEALAIVEGVVGLTTAFQRNVVAEGMETVEHGVMLLRLGCLHAQGYAIARPMPVEAVPAWATAFEPDPRWVEAATQQWLREDFPLIAAEVEHRRWIDLLAQALELGDAMVLPPEPGDHTHCRFGAWYRGPGRVSYGHLPCYDDLDEPHRVIHELAHEAAQLLLEGEHREARARVPELRRLGRQLLAELDALQTAIMSQRDPRAAAVPSADDLPAGP
jgi:diguanylate cyclase (GGDEF)-like protein/PAS domain S-box-containing protein